MVVKRQPNVYKKSAHQVRLYRDDYEAIWQALETLGDGSIVARVETKTETAELTESVDFRKLGETRFKSITIESQHGVEVVLRRREAFVRATDPDNAQMGVVTKVSELIGARTSSGLFMSLYVLIMTIMMAGALGSQQLVQLWQGIVFGLSLVLGVVSMLLLVKLHPEATLSNRLRPESFWARTRDDFIVNGIFTLVGAAIGFVLGRM